MEARGKTAALIVAAGSGSRAGGTPKQFRRVAGRSLLAHAVQSLRHTRIDVIQVVVGGGQEDYYRAAVDGLPLSSPVIGGATRQQSVRNGLEGLARNGGFGRVLIHDAARPFVPGDLVDRLLDALEDNEGAVPVLPIVDTLARRGESLGETVSRDELVRVQTPQAFRFADVLEAHRAWSGGEATDDAQIVRAAGMAVAMVEGDSMLEKLTYQEDFDRVERMRSIPLVSRTGLGFDVHQFGPGESIWLGGVSIAHDRGLVGHSDADVLLHALTDALLGAIGAGDIGDHFPPSEPKWRGAASSQFLEHARDLVEAQGGRISHVDSTIICEAPRVGPHRQAMREHIAGLLRLPVDRVSIKATTTERLGFTGRSEGIAAQAIATVLMKED